MLAPDRSRGELVDHARAPDAAPARGGDAADRGRDVDGWVRISPVLCASAYHDGDVRRVKLSTTTDTAVGSII